jgi:hypothetical protein
VRAFVLVAATCAALVLAAPAVAGREAMTEVVVTLEAPGLAEAIRTSRVLSAAVRARRLDLDSPTSTSYVEELEKRQRAVARRIEAAVPSARVRWWFTVVLNGLSVWLPRRAVQPDGVAGTEHVYPGGGFRTTLDRSPRVIGANELWTATAFPARGEGMKIGIIDDGVDQSHPFFDPDGYSYPPGFPKGNREFTTPKVIVARAFAHRRRRGKHARLRSTRRSRSTGHTSPVSLPATSSPPVQGGNVSGTAPGRTSATTALSTPSCSG